MSSGAWTNENIKPEDQIDIVKSGLKPKFPEDRVDELISSLEYLVTHNDDPTGPDYPVKRHVQIQLTVMNLRESWDQFQAWLNGESEDES